MSAGIFGCWALAAVILGACSAGDGLSLPSQGEPTAIAVVQGDSQSARVKEALAKPLVVEVTDARDRPVEGATVTFELTTAGPEADVAPHTTTTNANGEASAQVVLGTTTGRQAGTARVTVGTGLRAPEASFTAMALSENANIMAPVAGEDQTGHVGAPLNDRLVVRVTDAFGNPISGVPIGWTVQGGGSVSADTVYTDDQGRASVERILGPTAGEQITLATSEGLAGSPVKFTHAALAGDATRLAIISGDDQTGQVGTQLPAELVVRLIDADENGVAGAAVTWVVPVGGGSVTPTNSVTDADGRASAQWTLGGAPGANRVDAVVSGVGSVSFNATGTAGAPAVLSIVTQPSPSARNGIRLERQPVIQLRDAGGNAVARAGVPISAALGSGSGDLTGTRQQTTDANGQATFTDLAVGGPAGPYTLVFSAAGFASVTSSAINLSAIPTVTTITSDSPDPTAPGAAFTVEFRVSSEGSTPDGSVTVTDGVESCSGTLSNGIGRCQLALSTPGDRTLRATYPGGTGLGGSSATATHRVVAPPPNNQAPTADYNWHCDGLTCQFADHSSDPDGSIASRSWNFGDGSGAISETNPTHTFPASGSYTVTLSVTDNDGATDDASAAVSVQAPPPNQAPTAAFTADCKEMECKFNPDGSTDADGRIEGYAWNFGDGSSSNDRNPKHDYAGAGTYTVSLTVTDDHGATGQTSNSITVNGPPPPPNKPPHAEFEDHCTNLDCSFTNKSTDEDGSVTGFQWNFGDGQGSTDPSPSHSYSSPGHYQVSLTVTDNSGATDSRTHDVEAKAPPPANQPPHAEFGSSCSGLTCGFTDQSTDNDGNVSTWSWNFGDGTSSTARNPSHGYNSGGTYNVTLTVADNDGATNAVTHQVTVTAPPPPNQPPSAAFTSSCSDLTCSFTDQSTDGDGTVVSWSWTFGDGGSSTDRSPSHSYSVGGTYNVTLTATDNDGATNSVTHQVTVTAPPPPNQPPSAEFTQSCPDLTCSFTDQSTDADGNVVGWSWDFGDGNSSTDRNPSHLYAAAGDYTVILIVTDNQGASSPPTSHVVSVPPAQQAGPKPGP